MQKNISKLMIILLLTDYATASEPTRLDDVVVSASRTNIELDKSPVSMKIITKKQIEEQLALTSNSSDVLSNLLVSYTPSRAKMNGNGETLRGRKPLILIDGVPQSNPLRPTGREIRTIDFSMVEKIEVINGANSSNGISATGGVINIITKKPKSGKINQSISIQSTQPTRSLDSDTSNYKLSYSINGATEKFDYLISGSYEDQGLYLDGNGNAVGADNTQGDLMDSKAYDILAKIGYWIDDDQNVKFSINKYNIKNKYKYTTVNGDKSENILTTSKKETPRGEAPFNDVLTTSLSYNNDDFYGNRLSLMAFSQNFEGLFGGSESTSFQDPAIAPVVFDQTRTKTDKYGAKVTINKDGLFNDKLNISYGFDTSTEETFQDLYLTNRTYVPNSTYTNIAPFIQASFNILDNLTLHTGFRYEFSELEVDSYTTVNRYNNVKVQGGTIDIKEHLSNVGLVYDLNKNINFFVNYSQGFDIPDIGRALRSINTTGVNLKNFKNLDPILTDNYEFGFRSRFGIFDFGSSIYLSKSDFGNRIAANADGQYLLQREKTEIKGLETNLGVQVNKNHRLTFSYARSQGKYDSNDNGSLDARLDGLNISPDRFISSWSASWNQNFSTFLQFSHNFSRNFDVESRKFSGYSLLDLASNYKLDKNSSLSLSVANLLDKQYVTYYSQSAVDDDSRYTAGRGRTVTIGYKFNF